MEEQIQTLQQKLGQLSQELATVTKDLSQVQVTQGCRCA